MHLHTGEMKVNGAHGPIWMQTALCHKLLKTETNVTKDRSRVDCRQCLAEMRKADELLQWLDEETK